MEWRSLDEKEGLRQRRRNPEVCFVFYSDTKCHIFKHKVFFCLFVCFKSHLQKEEKEREGKQKISFAACSHQLAAKLRTFSEGREALWPRRPVCCTWAQRARPATRRVVEHTMFAMDIRNSGRQDACIIYHPNFWKRALLIFTPGQ